MALTDNLPFANLGNVTIFPIRGPRDFGMENLDTELPLLKSDLGVIFKMLLSFVYAELGSDGRLGPHPVQLSGADAAAMQP